MIDTIKDSYLNWIKENTKFTNVKQNIVELSSPFLDAMDENIKIYIENGMNEFKISDDGFTIWSLESSGVSFRKGSTRDSILKSIVNQHGINISEGKELYKYVDEKNLGNSMHTFLQSILSISDMLMYSTHTIENLFFDEVNKYFNENKQLYDPFPFLEIIGRSKLSYRFDFLMNVKNNNKKLVTLINYLTQAQIERALISWEDTSIQRKKLYNENIQMVTLINDKERKLTKEYEEAFITYGIEPIEFSNKKQIEKSLSYVG